MALNLTTAKAEFFSWASSDNIFKIDGKDSNLKKFLVDPNSAKTGWGKIKTGEPAHFVWSDVAGTRIERPTAEHKPAFSVLTYVSMQHGATVEGLRDWQSNGRAQREAVESIWDVIEEEAAKNDGKWAVIEVSGSHTMQIGPAKINVPDLKVVGWAPVPDTPEIVPPASAQQEAAEQLADSDVF